MELRPIPAADWADWYENELCTTFPDCECKPLADILSLAEAGRYEVLGLYDGPICWAMRPCGAPRTGRAVCCWTTWASPPPAGTAAWAAGCWSCSRRGWRDGRC